ncbi:MAG TPA: ATP-binding protein [Methanospirillum sp.]|nr:ATP-binding protein [Methanospirillum sp.]
MTNDKAIPDGMSTHPSGFYIPIAIKLVLIVLITALIPLCIVSLVSISSISSIADNAKELGQEIAGTAMRDSSRSLTSELTAALSFRTKALGQQISTSLQRVQADTTELAAYTTYLYNHPDSMGKYAFPTVYSYGREGRFGSISPTNTSWLAVFTSGRAADGTIPKSTLDEIFVTEWLDTRFTTIGETNPYATQIYLNTKSQISRGMPFSNGSQIWLNAPEQFPVDMNLEEYDFYYLANETNDPERKPVWTSLYYDPAGLGWMISSIAPVYAGDELKGVVGIDITLARMIDEILNVQIEKSGFAFLMSEKGDLIAFPERAAPFLGFSGDLTGTFSRGEELQYNLLQKADQPFQEIVSRMIKGEEGIVTYQRPDTNEEFFFAYAPVNQTGWSVGVVVPSLEVTEPSRASNARIQAEMDRASDTINDNLNGLMMTTFFILILILIAMIPLSWFLMSIISRPIRTLTQGSQQIGDGVLDHRITLNTRDELEDLAGAFNRMAEVLSQKITEIEAVNRELRQMDHIKSQFISIASHELRTPLIAIKGYLDLLLKDKNGNLNDDQKRMLGIVTRNTSRLARIITDILDISRIEENRLVLIRDLFSISDVIREVAEEQQTSIERRKHQLIVELSSDIPEVFGDRDRIYQVFINLLGNAIKYTPDGGIITIRAQGDGDIIHCSVSDTGIGIRTEDIGKIFSRFYQASDVITHRSGKDEFLAGGTGLGLSIVKGIVEAHGGEITVESEYGKGTTFSIILPGSKEPKSDNRPDDSHQMYQAVTFGSGQEQRVMTRLTILIIDDESDTLTLMQDLLAERFVVLTALSGATGMKRTFAERPDLILLDAYMPGISGFDVCKILKRNQSVSNIPIIIFTAGAQEQDRKAAQEAGADGYITKPFRPEDLYRIIAMFYRENSDDNT